MQRHTISLDDELSERFEQWIAQHGYANRSEAIRDLVRERLGSEALGRDPGSHCVAAVSYVYGHEERELASRLNRSHHHHHELSVSALHVHLDADRCLEVSILRGYTAEVRTQCDALIAQRGVHYGHVHLIPDESPLPRGHRHSHSHTHR